MTTLPLSASAIVRSSNSLSIEGSSRAFSPNSSREIFFSFAIRRNTAPAETCRMRKASASWAAYVDLPVPCGPLTVMIMLKRWKNGRGLEPPSRDSSGTILLQTALMEPERSSNISTALTLELHAVPFHSGNTEPLQGLLAQNAEFFSLTAVSQLTFFDHEFSDVGLSLCISCRRGH